MIIFKHELAAAVMVVEYLNFLFAAPLAKYAQTPK